MRRANQAIIRERIPIPTVDEVVENLNGSAVFSKLDLRLGFHQIELDEESRDITTFATHEGLFRYKRLSFGVNSAPEKYQQIIRQVVSDIEGVLNIEFLVSKETVVLRRWERSKQKFGFIKRVDKGRITTVKDLES